MRTDGKDESYVRGLFIASTWLQLRQLFHTFPLLREGFEWNYHKSYEGTIEISISLNVRVRILPFAIDITPKARPEAGRGTWKHEMSSIGWDC